jgi:hypothetical protein
VSGVARAAEVEKEELMDEYAEIYWLDERNATTVNDHRRPGSSGGWTQAVGQMTGRPQVVSVTPTVRTQPAIVRYPNGAPGRQPVMIAPAEKTTVLGGLAIGQIIEMATQLLAALQPLPSAPISTADVAKDVGNLVMYQTALASHAKRDEQLRTLGSLIGQLVK